MLEDKESKIERYTKAIWRLRDQKLTEQRSLDKLIITLSSGAIVLSFSLIATVVSLGCVYSAFLIASWILLACCIYFTINSYNYSVKCFQARIDQLEGLYQQDNKGKEHSLRIDQLSGKVKRYNGRSRCSFITGMVLFVILGAMIVIGKDINMNRKEHETTGRPLSPMDVEKRGADPGNLTKPEFDYLEGQNQGKDDSTTDAGQETGESTGSEEGAKPK